MRPSFKQANTTLVSYNIGIISIAQDPNTDKIKLEVNCIQHSDEAAEMKHLIDVQKNILKKKIAET